MVRQEDKAKIRNVRVITSEECVPKHKLLVMDMRFKATKRRRRKFKPRVRVWKLKEEKTCEEFRCMVGDKVEEVKWKGLGVNDHWLQDQGEDQRRRLRWEGFAEKEGDKPGMKE